MLHILFEEEITVSHQFLYPEIIVTVARVVSIALFVTQVKRIHTKFELSREEDIIVLDFL